MAKCTVVIYYNALSRRAQRYASVYTDYLMSQNTVVTIASSASRNTDIQRLREQCAHAVECVAIGGDGSVNIVANVIANTATALSVIPVGTGNDFAASQGITSWRWRLTTAVVRQTQSLGLVQPANMYFVNHVGSGLSVDLMRLQPSWLKRTFGKLSYTVALLRYLFGRSALRSRIRHAQHWDDGQIVALGRCIGGGIRVFPEATRQNAELAWVGVPKMPRLQQMKALAQVWRGRIQQADAIEFEVAKQFTLGDAEHRVELDGDIYFHGPVTVRAVEHALIVTLPCNAADETADKSLKEQ